VSNSYIVSIEVVAAEHHSLTLLIDFVSYRKL